MVISKRTYNLIIEDLIEYLRGTNGDYETYALYVAIRMSYVNSKIFSPTPSKIASLCDVGYTKACKLVAKAKSDTTGHFRIARRDNGLVALSNKGQRIRTDKRGKEYKSDFCHKISCGEYKLKDIVRILKKAMLSHFIDCATSERNRADEKSDSDVKVEPKMIRQEVIQRFCYMRRSSMNKLILQLEKEGIFQKSKKTLVKVIDNLNEETVSRYRGVDFFVWKKWKSAWVCLTCTYLINESAKSTFRNIFWHKRRRSTRNKHTNKTAKVLAGQFLVGDIDVEKYFAIKHD